jgi:hypothetical protein
VMRFIRLHPGAQKGNAANYWSLFEPHYKQNLSANPKRTAKSLFCLSDASHLNFVQIIFFRRKFLKELQLMSHRSHRKRFASRDTKTSLEIIFKEFPLMPKLSTGPGFYLRRLGSST